MDISENNIDMATHMSGRANLYAVMYQQHIEETAVTNQLACPYRIEGRILQHFNPIRDCIDFFFNAIQKQICEKIKITMYGNHPFED